MSNVAVITGGSSGIGLAAAIRFVEAGYRVAISGRHPDKRQRATQIIRQSCPDAECLALGADLADATQAATFIDRVHQHYGRIDVLVNSAGSAKVASAMELDPADFQHLLGDNITATFSTCRAAIPHLRRGGGGVIINVSSQSVIDPFLGLGVYGACKAWIERFSQSLATELAEDHIAVFVVRPGAVETPMLRECFPDFPAEKALPPADVAEIIWQLTDVKWRHATGAAIPVQIP